MDDLVRAGKIPYWGTSKWPVANLGELDLPLTEQTLIEIDRPFPCRPTM